MCPTLAGKHCAMARHGRQQTLRDPTLLGRLAAHAPGGPLQRFVAEVLEECASSPTLVGLLSARLCALWAAHPGTARAYLGTWERLLLYGDPCAGTEAAALEVRQASSCSAGLIKPTHYMSCNGGWRQAADKICTCSCLQGPLRPCRAATTGSQGTLHPCPTMVLLMVGWGQCTPQQPLRQ